VFYYLLKMSNINSNFKGYLSQNILLIIVIFGCFSRQAFAQQKSKIKVHSHNDYLQKEPFWAAYYAGCASIEVDVFYVDGKILVAHNLKDTLSSNTLSSMYLQPLNQMAVMLKSVAKPKLQLLIDVKSEADSSLKYIVAELKKYPEIIGVNNPKSNITFVITGHKPKPENYVNYPEFIKFDHQDIKDLSAIELSKVGLVSLAFGGFSDWKGIEAMPQEDEKKIKEIIELSHSKGKLFRFWGTPDTPLAWAKFKKLRIDFINTDKPKDCVEFFKNKKKN
jgi:alkaline phosphatase